MSAVDGNSRNIQAVIVDEKKRGTMEPLWRLAPEEEKEDRSGETLPFERSGAGQLDADIET